MSPERRPHKEAKRPKAKSRKVELLKLVEKSSRFLNRERVPRSPAEMRAWSKQISSDARAEGKMREASRWVPETWRHAVPQWIEPPIMSPHLVKWFVGVAKAYILEDRARSMDVLPGLIRPRGRPRATQGNRSKTAIQIDDLKDEGLSWYEIEDRLSIEARTARRIYAANSDAILKRRISRHRPVLLGDLKDGRPVINGREAATVRMLFERYARLSSAPAPKLALAALKLELEAEGITDKHGKPIDIDKVINNRVYVGGVIRPRPAWPICACKVINTPVYIGEAIHKRGYKVINTRVRYIGVAVHKGTSSGEHEAIVDRALWLKVHRVRRVLTAACHRKGHEGGQ